ncbi:MAG: bifunctional oligoribonuclease/PAP phosphatase NrnA [Ruminococcaceae bacterium]|nr:bifunctional oligoribonuclease/PAP phosphatase NrnA [Oscillospiraceae bacterium]
MIDIVSLLSAVEKCQNAIIVGHSHPDGDCVGSAVALAHLIEGLGGKAEIIFPEKAPHRIEFILGGRKELDALPENLDGFQIICVDLASPVQMASLRDAIENRVCIRIDHHDVSTPYAAEEFVAPKAAAAGYIIFELYKYALGEGKVCEIPLEAVNAMYAAISSDTGCFKYANVTPATHITAARLIEIGANAAEINRLLFDTKDENQLKAEGIALSRIETFANGQISGIAIELSDYEGGLNIKDFETAIDFARSVRGARCVVSVKASPTVGTFRASLRSNDDTDVSKIAAMFGGGGHIRAAGCSVEASSAKEALDMIVKELEKVL